MFVGRISRVRLNPVILDQMSYGKIKELLKWVATHTDYCADEERTEFYFPVELNAEYQPNWLVAESKDELVGLARNEFKAHFAHDILEYGDAVFMFNLQYSKVRNGMFSPNDYETVSDVKVFVYQGP